MTTPPILEVDSTTSVGSFDVTARFEATVGVTALFGPSGAGKSVTLATVAGLLRPRRGSIRLHGEVVADAASGHHVPTQQRRLGMVFQHAALLPHRSPLDNVAMAVRGGDRATRRTIASEMLGRVHAAHLASARTSTLSGGEQQRVALARAVAGDPQVLLLDEPFSALDQPTRTSLRELVREVVADGRIAAILVTHDVDDIVHLADQVVRFEPGRSIETVDLAGGDRAQLDRVLGLDR